MQGIPQTLLHPVFGRLLHTNAGAASRFEALPYLVSYAPATTTPPWRVSWGTIKNELIYHCRYRTREEAIKEISEYIEVFYNRQRRQKRLGYLSPAAYERQFYTRRAAA
jgi:transposase InsO family protein